MAALKRIGAALVLAFAGACSGHRAALLEPVPPAPPTPPADPAQLESPEAASADTPATSVIGRRFEEHLEKHRDLTFEGLKKAIGFARTPVGKLSFDPTKARHYNIVDKQLEMTAAERALFKRQGLVVVDHEQRYSMGSIYYAIYARDLPVLITTDSVLHALHRSYDKMLKELELGLFQHTIDEVLAATHGEVKKALGEGPADEVRRSLADVDLYLTVARNLLRGAGAPPNDQSPPHLKESWDGSLLVKSVAGNDAAAGALLKKVSKLELERPGPGCAGCTAIYGGRRPVDYSQFRPRGHYTEHPDLKKYFRALMWLGRADLGFNLAKPAPQSGLVIDSRRERLDAATLTLMLRQSGKLPRLRAMSQIIDFMVGVGDDVTVDIMARALESAGVERPATLTENPAWKKLAGELAKAGGRQIIRSQVLGSPIAGTQKTPPPLVFQMFGQRFLLDSFVLANVVFDSIIFKGEKQHRMMPKGLDVAAALGNDEAVALLQPELGKHHYSANLLAARHVVDGYTEGNWNSSLYNVWLDALRTLDDAPPEGSKVPQAMRGRAWQRKQLQTQLASWAELRHDTLLYGKQSYTAYPVCGYPAGYVEPYPKFFDRLEFLARDGARRLSAADVSHSDASIAKNMKALRDRHVGFLFHFSKRMAKLEGLAKKARDGDALDDAEKDFLKKTIDMRGGGSGPPTYSGWYPELVYGAGPAEWKPTVADVHTDPKSGQVMEVGVGDAQFIVVAVDESCGNSVYVGPVYSYYEFSVPASRRMTDPEWQARITSGKTPKRPAWMRAIATKAKKRHLARAPRR